MNLARDRTDGTESAFGKWKHASRLVVDASAYSTDAETAKNEIRTFDLSRTYRHRVSGLQRCKLMVRKLARWHYYAQGKTDVDSRGIQITNRRGW